MSRADSLAGLTEAIEAEVSDWCAHTVPVDMSVPSGCQKCYEIAAHVAAVALAWLEGHGWAEGAEGD